MILIFDLGTQSFRATVLDRKGHRHFEWSRPVTSNLKGNIAEQNPSDWKSALEDSFREILACDFAAQIQAITATGTLSGLVCLDENGDCLRPAILYSDRRAASHLPSIESHPEFQLSGWRAYSGDFLPQLCYLKNEEPHIYQRSKWLLDSTGYLNFLLTGKATLDRYTTYTCYSDAGAPELNPHLFHQLGIDRNKLGQIVHPGESLGTASQLNHAQVFSVSYDSAAAYLGSELNQPGDSLDISGTVTSFGVVSSSRLIDPARRVFSIPFQEKWLVRGSTAMSGGVLEWARKNLFDQEFDQLDLAVTASPPGANGVTFIPYLTGARAPLWDPSACGVFYGLSAQTNRADMARAVYEGLCFSLQDIIFTIHDCGTRVNHISLGGGLSQNPLLNQMKADITGKVVYPYVDQEITTLGSATIAARHLGWLNSEESFFRKGAAVHPQTEHQERYQAAFDRYQKLVRQLFVSEV